MFHDKDEHLCRDCGHNDIFNTSMKKFKQWKHERFEFNFGLCESRVRIISTLKKHISIPIHRYLCKNTFLL